jgi:hypothetical protein
MPIDFDALQADPDFARAFPTPEARQQAIARLRQEEGPPTPWYGVVGRAGGQTPGEPAGTVPQTPEEWEQRTKPMQQELKTGVEGAESLMLGAGLMQGGYQVGSQIAAKVLPYFGTVAKALPAALEAGGSYLARKINVAHGTEQPGVVGDIAAAALPPVVRGAAAAMPAAVRLSPPGQAITAAETQSAEQAAAVAARNARAQDVYAGRVEHATEQATAKTAAQEARYQRALTEEARLAEQRTAANQAAYEGQVQGYEGAVQQHRTALGELQAMPGQFRPATPSSTLYAAAAKANPKVELRQTAAMAEELMGTPEGLQTLQRGGVQPLAEELHELAQQSLSGDGLAYARLQKIRSDLGAEVGRLRRQGGVEYAEVAKLYGALERDIGASPAQVLQEASRARRQEYAVEELADMVRTGAPGIKRLSSGAYQVDPGQLMTRAEKTLGDTEKLFGGSFTPDERANILAQFERHQGLAPIPRRPGEPPLPVVPRDVAVPEPVTPRFPMRPVPLQPPAEVDPRTLLKPPSAGRIVSELGTGLLTSAYRGNLTEGMAIGGTLVGADLAQYALSKALLSPSMQPIVRNLMTTEGTISPANMAKVMQVMRARGMLEDTPPVVPRPF